jgi:hypothetical protein
MVEYDATSQKDRWRPKIPLTLIHPARLKLVGGAATLESFAPEPKTELQIPHPTTGRQIMTPGSTKRPALVVGARTVNRKA